MTVIDSTVPLPEEVSPAVNPAFPAAAEGYAVVTQEDGYVRLVLPAGSVITGGIAARAAAEFDVLADSGLVPLLLELTGIESITRSARAVFGAARSASAVAVLGTSQVDRVIANFLLGGDLPPCPTRYFSNQAEALAWLGSRTA